jgi:hypothetical protein
MKKTMFGMVLVLGLSIAGTLHAQEAQVTVTRLIALADSYLGRCHVAHDMVIASPVARVDDKVALLKIVREMCSAEKKEKDFLLGMQNSVKKAKTPTAKAEMIDIMRKVEPTSTEYLATFDQPITKIITMVNHWNSLAQ